MYTQITASEHNSIMASFQNKGLIKKLNQHGISEGTELVNFAKAFKHVRMIKEQAALVNSTESRVTLYSSDISPYLYPTNEFINHSQNDSVFAASGEIKRLNDAQQATQVVQGRRYDKSLVNNEAVDPLDVTIRKNTGHDWAIEYFHTTPQVSSMELTTETPYDNVGELLKSHADILNVATGNFTAIEWAQGEIGVGVTVSEAKGNEFFVFTSGTTRASQVPNQTTNPNVKGISADDMESLATKLRRQRTAGIGSMYFLGTEEHLQDLRKLTTFTNYNVLGIAGLITTPTGMVGKIYGINILDSRYRDDWQANILYSYTALVSGETVLTKVANGGAVADLMTSAAMAWVDKLVLVAKGSAMVFPWENSPLYLGNVYASESRFGAKRKRNDNKGVVMLIESPFVTP